MARSRSSFELTSAIATASTLAKAEKKPRGIPADVGQYRGSGVVSFQPTDGVVALPPPPDHDVTERPSRPPNDDGMDELDAPADLAQTTPREAAVERAKSIPVIAIPPPPPSSTGRDISDEADTKPRPPRLPDLSSVVSPIVRCERIVEWIAEATGGSGVFIADADGLPVAGEIQDAEARIGASGLVASSIATLLSALPGQPSPLFEVHIGEGPYFQLIGFTAGKGSYVVGLTRASALSPRQAHAIRLACRHAFGEPLSGGAQGAGAGGKS
jgi:hypothetical protein